MATPDEQKRFRAKLRKRAFDAIGWYCVFCNAKGCHAAHVKPTGLHGPGRGAAKRYRDVVKNPDAYRPMCPDCHRTFDKLMYDLFQMARGATEEPVPF